MINTEQPKNVGSTLHGANRDLEEKETIRKSKELNIGYVNILKYNINPDILKLISKEDMLFGMIFAFFQVGKKLKIGLIDPNNPKTKIILEKLRSNEYTLNINLASNASFQQALAQYENVFIAPKKVIENEITTDSIDTNLDEALENNTPVQMVNNIFMKAMFNKASDIHFEPGENKSIVRCRIDGMLKTITELGNDVFNDIIMQIKHQAKMKLNVTTRPQDGRTYFIVNGKKIDIRVSVLPSAFGEDIVMRILNSGVSTVTIEQLGFKNYAYEQVQKTLHTPHGMVIVTGPTGSGKTTTLYTLLQSLNTEEKKIITLEDPIEYHLEGITQSQVDEYEDYDFADGLRSILRQDPDIVMVGEIRDEETAEVAAQAALTGHKVLSTLHTNNAVAAIPRLRNMGLPTFMLASSLELIIAQRLVRKVCQECSKEVEIPVSIKNTIQENIEKINSITDQNYQVPSTIKEVVGCEKCSSSGYKGRIGIYETLYINDEIRSMILNEANEFEIAEHAQKEGMLTILQDGILKVIEGTTTMEEVYRVSQE